MNQKNPMKTNWHLALLVLMCSTIVTSCSSLPFTHANKSNTGPTSEGTTDDVKRHDSSVRKIAQNLVFSLVQIDSLNPYETTVYFYGTQHDVFDAEIRRAISDAGYAIRTTEDTRSINLVNRSVDLHSPGPLGTAVYTLSIGGVSASRA